MKEQILNYLQRLPLAGIEQRLPVWASLIVLVMLAHAMATLTWRLLPVPELESQGDSRRVVAQRPVQRQVANTARDISQWHLFGKVELQKPKPAPAQEVTAAPETRLNLKLRGVFSSKNAAESRAIIADAKGDEDSYSIGDPVPGGASLHQIHKDRVILERNGRFETLRLPVDDLPGNETSVASARPPVSRSPAPTAQLPTTGDTETLLREYRDALINNPQSVMGLVRAEPYQKDGQLKGYRIRPGKDRYLLRRFGLRSGDIVTSVNGVTMDNPIRALEVLRDLSSATQLTVEVERNGSPQSFTFSIGQ